MKKHIVTNWENDMIDQPEEMVAKFVSEKYKGFELKMLSGLRHRAFEDIYETLHDSFVIIMQPSLLDKQQVRTMVEKMAHGIWINFNSNVNNLSVRHFIFLSANPFEDLISIRKMCMGLKDTQGENALVKIVKSISCHFYGFDGEHYEMQADGYFTEDIFAIRHH